MSVMDIMYHNHALFYRLNPYIYGLSLAEAAMALEDINIKVKPCLQETGFI